MAKRIPVARLLMIVSILFVLSGCSFSFSFGGGGAAESAEELIEGDLSEKLNMELTNAECDEPAEETAGVMFDCTADYQGQTMQLTTEIESEERIFVNPTNVVFPAQLDAIEASVADLLNGQADYGLLPDSLDCGAEPIVFEGPTEFVCALTDPQTNEVYDTDIEMTDLNELIFNFEVSVEPR